MNWIMVPPKIMDNPNNASMKKSAISSAARKQPAAAIPTGGISEALPTAEHARRL
jgi:hypothetical protein